MRDVEGMGKAGGWLILGIGWIVDAKSPPGVNIYPAAVHSETSDDDHNMIVFDSKGKGRARPFHIASSTMSSSDSFDIATPDDDDNVQTTGEKIKLLVSQEIGAPTDPIQYNLLIPLLHLYRHGHIQHLDPVALPSLTSSQLPQALRPQGDHQKGRNVWALGSTVATKVLELPLLSAGGLTKEESMKRDGIGMVANYIVSRIRRVRADIQRGITSAPQIAEASFKTILRHGPCGIEVVDDLLHQAYRRLNVLLKTTGGSPLAQSELDAYPFLASDRTLGARRRSAASLLSLADSMVPSSLRLMTPVKSIASLASLSCEASTASAHDLPHDGHGGAAMQSLCNVQRHQRKLANRPPPVTNTWWPSLRNWSMTPRSPLAPIEREQTPPPERSSPTSDTFERKVPIRAVASSPQLGTRRLPFEPEHAVAKIDPEFAALELASALTKHVTCSVCGAGGVNFPNCRKCGLTFCCRKCRVDESGAGDGKR
jgi:hypothetical protein